MNTKLILSLFFICSISIVSAQKVKEIEPAILECQYKLVIQHCPMNKWNPAEDLMILRIGRKSSQFFSYYTFHGDSLWNDPIGNKIAMQLTLEAVRTKDFSKKPGAHTTVEYIYKSYPKQNQLTTYTSAGSQKTGSYPVYYTEEEKSQAWEMKDSTKVILGYPCKLASTEFRGRKYDAWFTTEIPLNNGPWKFCGLPGLILEVYDSQNEYHYTIIGIQKNNLRPVSFYNFWENEFEHTDRKAFLTKEANQLKNLSKENTEWDLMEKDYHK